MTQNLLLKYNGNVPRYTSYPTAPHFKPVTEGGVASSLAHLPAEEPVSVYVHVPYCKEMCWYCGCHTLATRKYAPVEDYTTLLLREVEILAEKLPGKLKVAHLHFGGGSPTMLQPDDFNRIMDTLRERFEFMAGTEICIEADPRGITHDKAETYARCGVNRMSFGIQDFSHQVQAAINRVQSPAVVEKALGLLRGFGIERFNFDLMYGLPRQTVKNVEETIYRSLQFSPDRIAFFGYAHVPWMKKHMRLIKDEDLPDASARIEQFARGESLLCSVGMVPVGLDHFVRIGDEMHKALQTRTLARNFQGYTTDNARTLLGLGMSSISQLEDAYVQNYSNITEYSAAVLAGTLPAFRGHRLTTEDKLRAEIISTLMCYFEADIPAILRQHGWPETAFDETVAGMAEMVSDGLVSVDQGVIRVSQNMRQAVRVVAARFDAYFTGLVGKHVQAA
jgi:oxygen-independent coproporphyrinogen-3 oxidase